METPSEKSFPLKALVALESAVRHGSFTRASQEMHVTPGAISKQIGLMEDWLNEPLFDRDRGALTPTAHAPILARAMAHASDGIGAALSQIGKARRRSTVRILAPATFAMRWLIPRL